MGANGRLHKLYPDCYPDENGNRSVSAAYLAFIDNPANRQAWGKKNVKRWVAEALGETPRERERRSLEQRREAQWPPSKKERRQRRKSHKQPAPQKATKGSANTPSLRTVVYERDGYRCVACGVGVDLTLDHVVPRSKGGLTVEANLQTMCSPCNNAKGDTMPLQYSR